MKNLLAILLAVSPSFVLVAQDAPKPPAMPDNGFIQTLTMLGMGMVFFYFILYRPEQKKRKALDESKEKLKKGDRVVAVGIIGTVYKVDKDTVILKMVDESKIEVIKAAITQVLTQTKDVAPQ